MNVGIIGFGYVGLTLGVVACHKGYNIYAIDKNDYILNSLNKSKKAHFFEPGLDALIEDQVGTCLFASDSFDQTKSYDVFIITVGTPLVNGKKEPNFNYIQQALESMNGIYDGSQLVILRSTVSVGVTRSIVIPYLSKLAGIKEDEVRVSFCPERTVEGKAIRELQELPQVIGANNEKAQQMAEDFFRRITPYIIKVESLEAAELIKLFNNTYRDISFSIGNVFNEIAQNFGLNGLKLIEVANQGYDRSNIPKPGFVGGPCLTKDAHILTHSLDLAAGKEFVLNSRKYNASLPDKVVAWVEKNISKKDTIAVSGLAFKGVPATSDLRDSDPLKIAITLKEKGFKLNVHDFVANEQEISSFDLGTCYSDFEKLAEDSDHLLILNNNNKYKQFNIKSIINSIGVDGKIVDIWDVYETSVYYKDCTQIKTLGNMLIK